MTADLAPDPAYTALIEALAHAAARDYLTQQTALQRDPRQVRANPVQLPARNVAA